MQFKFKKKLFKQTSQEKTVNNKYVVIKIKNTSDFLFS